jgi:prepilin-type N-terminal cleavage/methylation domain-containing protein
VKVVSGFSLIELLVGLALAAFIMLGLSKAYISVTHAYRAQSVLSDIQDRGRFSVFYLSRIIKMSGANYCESVGYKNTTVDKFIIRGFRGREDLPGFLQGQVKSGADSLIVGECFLYKGDYVFRKVAFFIGNTGRKEDGHSIYSLYQKAEFGRRKELVSNVVNLSIKYGPSNEKGDSVERYVTAGEVSDWLRVRAVVVELLLRAKGVGVGNHVYQFNGVMHKSYDGYLYRSWRFYNYLRNR